MTETWRDIPNYEGLYEVSDKGRVRSKEGKTTYTERHGVRKWKSRILKEKNKKGREVRVSLWKDGKSKDFLVHQLVGFAFLSNPNKYKSINHLDGNPRNNNVENLEWCDHYINNNHAFDNRLIKTGKRTSLFSIKTREMHDFRSISKASEFLGRSTTYLRNNKIADGHLVFIKE